MTQKIQVHGTMRELSITEGNQITGGNGFYEHLKCIQRTFSKSPLKTIFLGGTIMGLARNVGIIVGCGTPD